MDLSAIGILAAEANSGHYEFTLRGPGRAGGECCVRGKVSSAATAACAPRRECPLSRSGAAGRE